ncbi:MAG: 4-(cytidine 5'-diphospho)-2-C-methyl-D-erythritol kinase [Lachnospiraceae bacterium]|nr:4-(cytidine 5'-diphospho)-2-C-methyl-D-erythritol kinase [Lachnospiraceae bacterium]
MNLTIKKHTAYAYAKINLSLDILGTRPDGYHEVQMLMQSLTLHDTITLTATEEKGIVMTCSDTTLPVDEHNLAYRAAVLFCETYDIPCGIKLHLEKKIPVAAGLAGGSSDAAAVLRGLNEMFDFPATKEELAALGLRLGADVPYCLMLGTALSEGIGEKLTALPAAPSCYCLLVKPEAGASTKQIYTDYDALAATTDIAHPDTEGLLSALSAGDFAGITSRLCNVLEPVTLRLVPEIATVKETLRELNADGVLMSGSGPTVFALFSDKEKAQRAEAHFKQTSYAPRTFLTEFYQPM